MNRVIIILVMAEEKWHEANFLRREIEARGDKVLIMDIGLTEEPQGQCDITREEVINASGYHPDQFAIMDRGKRMPVMVAGGKAKMKVLYSQGELSGVISLGGTTGTQMGTSIMKSLPFGVPKFALSSTAALRGLAEKYIGTADITLMHSVVEFGGLDSLMKNALARAAGAVCAMVESSEKYPVSFLANDKELLVAMTQFGPCEQCAISVRRQLEERGYKVIAFSASGVGDRAMEEMIGQLDMIGAVIDLAPGGVGEELLGFTRAAGPARLETAGKKGIPQVIGLCGVNFGSPRRSEYRPEYAQRKKYDYDELRTFMRLSQSELVKVADVMADKINRANGPVKVIVALGGWSSVDRRGSYFYDGDADSIFVSELKSHLRPDIEVREVDADLDTPEYARAVVKAFHDIVPSQNSLSL